MENILITGGTGLVGKRLSEMLLKEGYAVSLLSRSKGSPAENLKYYHWNIDESVIAKGALETADHIINLAGASIAGGRWTSRRKKEIYSSRINGTSLLAKKLKETEHHVKTIISASAVGYYGNRGGQWISETEPAGNDFLAKVCRDWEAQTQDIADLGIRAVILRMGIVLTRDGGALPELEKTMRFGLASYLGTGDQYYPWIHIDDVCRMYIHAIKNKELNGPYNAVAPSPVTNFDMTKAIRSAKKSLALMLPAPSFALKAILGEMSQAVLFSQRCSSVKIEKTGFEFNYSDLKEALANLYS